MTASESMEIINDKIETCEFYFAEHDHYPEWCEYEFLEALGIAISALKEVQQYKDQKLCLVSEDVYSRQCSELDSYKEIGTVEECREAVEKQKPIIVNEVHVDEYFCPACLSENNCDYGKVHDKYCPMCGHAIYQEESEEE